MIGVFVAALPVQNNSKKHRDIPSYNQQRVKINNSQQLKPKPFNSSSQLQHL